MYKNQFLHCTAEINTENYHYKSTILEFKKKKSYQLTKLVNYQGKGNPFRRIEICYYI